MNDVRLVLLAALVVLAWWLGIAWWRQARAAAAGRTHQRPSWFTLMLGFVTNFFDVLGIGSFAPTTAVIRARKLMPAEEIPGTLNIGHAVPSIAQALIFVSIIEVDTVLLVAMIVMAILGAWLGASVVVRLDRQNIQLGMGFALLIAAALFIAVNLGMLPSGGDALSLEGWKLWLALGVNFILGALMTLGVGNYGPCLIMLSLLGMNPIGAFPIMTASSAFLMPVASFRFLKSARFHQATALGLTLGGIPGVLVAAYIVKSLPMVALRWVVAFAVTYAAASMLRAAFAGRAGTAT